MQFQPRFMVYSLFVQVLFLPSCRSTKDDINVASTTLGADTGAGGTFHTAIECKGKSDDGKFWTAAIENNDSGSRRLVVTQDGQQITKNAKIISRFVEHDKNRHNSQDLLTKKVVFQTVPDDNKIEWTLDYYTVTAVSGDAHGSHSGGLKYIGPDRYNHVENNFTCVEKNFSGIPPATITSAPEAATPARAKFQNFISSREAFVRFSEGVAAVEIHGKIYVANGVCFGTTTRCEAKAGMYDPASDKWTLLPPPPLLDWAKIKGGLKVNNQFWISTSPGGIFIYDPPTGAWSKSTCQIAFPQGSIVLGNHIVGITNNDSTLYNRMWVSNLDLSSCSIDRYLVSLDYSDTVYNYCGYSLTRIGDSVFFANTSKPCAIAELDLKTLGTSDLPTIKNKPLPDPAPANCKAQEFQNHSSSAVATYGGKIFSFGGWPGHWSRYPAPPSKDLMIFDPKSFDVKIITGSPFLNQVDNAAAVSIGSYLFIWGREDPHNNIDRNDSIGAVFDMANQRWIN